MRMTGRQRIGFAVIVGASMYFIAIPIARALFPSYEILIASLLIGCIGGLTVGLVKKIL